jgi:dihydroflavonol-4-reductase
MRIFVLGATGHLGQAVVRHALARGYTVTAATRQADPPALRGLTVRIVQLDGECSRLREVSARHDVLVDAAAPYPLEPCMVGSAPWRAAVDGAVARTRLVVEAAKWNSLRLAFISSFTTLPRREAAPAAMESAWRRSVFPYFEAKVAMERVVVDAAREGLPALIVNPAACLGPWEFRAENSSLVRLVMARRLPLMMDQTLSVIDVRNVAAAIEAAIERELFGRPIALAGHNVTLVELARQILELDGTGGSAPLAVNASVASMAAFWTAVSYAAWNQATPDPWRAVPLAADGFAMDPSPEQISLGLKLFSLSETLRDAVCFHRTCWAS